MDIVTDLPSAPQKHVVLVSPRKAEICLHARH